MAKGEIQFVLRGLPDVLAAIKALTTIHTDYNKPDFVCVIKPFQKDRSLAQNSLFHTWVGVIADDTGSDRGWVKNEIKRKFLGVERHKYKDEAGETKYAETIRKTSHLKVGEMNNFMNAVQAWAATELGITLPVPEDLAWSIQEDRAAK